MTHFCRAKNEEKRLEEHRIIGDCLERLGIPNGGIAVIDRNASIDVGDVVWCTKISGQIGGYLKQVVSMGETITVGTAYLDSARDFTFPACEILGKLKQVMDYDRNVVWARG